MTEPLGPAIRRELARFGAGGRATDMVAAWPAAVGRQIAENAWPARTTRDGTIVVHTRDAVWAFELTQRAEEIRTRLGVKALRFVPGPVPESPGQATRERGPAPPAATVDESRRAAEWAAPIDDPELRALVARTARASLAKARSQGRSDHRF